MSTTTVMATPTTPGSLVMATTASHPSPDRWFAEIGGRWANPLNQIALPHELTVLAVLHDADPTAEVNHR